ncbi:MAG: CHAT domain-containing protein [Bacteroidota bacterium]
MPQAVPIILLAFANDREGQFLRNLAGEQQAISQALREAEKQGRCEILVLPNASLEDIIRTFKEERDRIVIFHYGGHADGNALHLSSQAGGEAIIDGESFADFLGHQDSLELVFLNGCATLAQKDHLLRAGVKRVILTDQAINDQSARQFATHFYQSLSTGASLTKSFEEAESVTLLVNQGNSRKLYWEAPKSEAKTLPWQLHKLPTQHENWQLDATPSKPPTSNRSLRIPLIFVGILALLGLGYGLMQWNRTKEPSVPPQVTQKLPPWYESGNIPSFTGKVQDQDERLVDEASVEVENLKDLNQITSRSIDAHLGTFVLQLSPEQMGPNPADSVRFIISKQGYLKTVQWMQIAHLWRNQQTLNFLLLKEAESAPENGGGPKTNTNEVVISTQMAEVLQQQNTQEVLKRIKIDPKLYLNPTSKIDYDRLRDLQVVPQMIEVSISLPIRSTRFKWKASVNGKEVKPTVKNNVMLLKLLKTQEAARIEIRADRYCMAHKLVPDRNHKLDLSQDFARCQ